MATPSNPKKRKIDQVEFTEPIPPIKRIRFCTNSVCPITMEDIDELKTSNSVLFLWINGKRYVYNMHELYNYIFKYKKFLEPYTKYPFSIRQLDYILCKNINNSHIATYNEYNSVSVQNPKEQFEYNIYKYSYYYKRVTNYLSYVLEMNNSEIFDFWEDYYAMTCNLDVFERSYIILPLMFPYSINEYKISLSDRNMLLSEYHDIGYTCYRCTFTGKKLYEMASFKIIKLFGTYYNINELFKNVLSGNFMYDNKNLTLEHIDIIFYRYFKYLESMGKISGYLYSYNPVTYKEYNKNYKHRLLDVINKRLYVYYEIHDINDDSIYKNIRKFWNNYWVGLGYNERMKAIPYGCLKSKLIIE